MGGEPENKGPRDTGSILFALIVAGIIVAAGAVAYVAYVNSQRIGGGQPYAIESGDSVTLNYIGRFSDGRIFDTSLWSVAQDDANYSKSLTFGLRSEDSYEAFSMTAGKYGAGGTIKGFALGVLGLHVGDYKIIEALPEEAYPVDAEMLVTTNLTQTVPVKEQYSTSSFRNFFGTDPIPLSTLSHHFWNWKVLVASVVSRFRASSSRDVRHRALFDESDPGRRHLDVVGVIDRYRRRPTVAERVNDDLHGT